MSGDAPSAKCRRVSSKKFLAFAGDLARQEDHSETKKLFDKAVSLLRTKDSSQLRAIIAFIVGPKIEEEAAAKFPRGVRFMSSSTASRCVPDFMVRRCVASVLNLPETEVKAWRETTAWLRRLFLAAAGKEAEDELPELCMGHGEFHEWFLSECRAVHTVSDWQKQAGQSLEQAFLAGKLGAYSLVKAGSSYSLEFSYVRNNITGDHIKLPKACSTIEVTMVPHRFVITNNWSQAEAALLDMAEDEKWMLWSRFLKPDNIVELDADAAQASSSAQGSARASVKTLTTQDPVDSHSEPEPVAVRACLPEGSDEEPECSPPH